MTPNSNGFQPRSLQNLGDPTALPPQVAQAAQLGGSPSRVDGGWAVYYADPPPQSAPGQPSIVVNVPPAQAPAPAAAPMYSPPPDGVDPLEWQNALNSSNPLAAAMAVQNAKTRQGRASFAAKFAAMTGVGALVLGLLIWGGYSLWQYAFSPKTQTPTYPSYAYPGYPAAGYPSAGYPATGYPSTGYPSAGYPGLSGAVSATGGGGSLDSMVASMYPGLPTAYANGGFGYMVVDAQRVVYLAQDATSIQRTEANSAAAQRDYAVRVVIPLNLSSIGGGSLSGTPRMVLLDANALRMLLLQAKQQAEDLRRDLDGRFKNRLLPEEQPQWKQRADRLHEALDRAIGVVDGGPPK